jgi:hypothetical protein
MLLNEFYFGSDLSNVFSILLAGEVIICQRSQTQISTKKCVANINVTMIYVFLSRLTHHRGCRLQYQIDPACDVRDVLCFLPAQR